MRQRVDKFQRNYAVASNSSRGIMLTWAQHLAMRRFRGSGVEASIVGRAALMATWTMICAGTHRPHRKFCQTASGLGPPFSPCAANSTVCFFLPPLALQHLVQHLQWIVWGICVLKYICSLIPVWACLTADCRAALGQGRGSELTWKALPKSRQGGRRVAHSLRMVASAYTSTFSSQ